MRLCLIPEACKEEEVREGERQQRGFSVKAAGAVRDKDQIRSSCDGDERRDEG